MKLSFIFASLCLFCCTLALPQTNYFSYPHGFVTRSGETYGNVKVDSVFSNNLALELRVYYDTSNGVENLATVAVDDLPPEWQNYCKTSHFLTDAQFGLAQVPKPNYHDPWEQFTNTSPASGANRYSSDEGGSSQQNTPFSIWQLLIPFKFVAALIIVIIALAAFWKLLNVIGRLFKKYSGADIILTVGAFVFVVCGLFPPWLYSYGSRIYPAGYHFLFNTDTGIRLDFFRLLDELVSVGALTGILFYLARLVTKGRQAAGQNSHLNSAEPAIGKDQLNKSAPKGKTD